MEKVDLTISLASELLIVIKIHNFFQVQLGILELGSNHEIQLLITDITKEGRHLAGSPY